MARPTTKQELISTGNTQYEKLNKLISSMTYEEQTAEFNFDSGSIGKEAHWKRDKNTRDVLTHLYEWHELLLNWITFNQSGKESPFLPSPYNWKTYGDMNVEFFNKHQTTDYEISRKLLKESHNKVMTLIETFSDDELFLKQHFSWTGTTSLGSYCISATSSHYDWAMKKIKMHIKNLKK
jgi:Uncharacterized conserved protein